MALSLSWTMPVAAQTESVVPGMLRAKTTGMPVELAIVALHEAETGKFRTGCITDSAGGFRFDRLPARKCYMAGSCVGRAPVRAGLYAFKPQHLIVPCALIGVGVIGLESDWLKYQNREIREELQENIDRKFTIDDFSQYVPIAAVYGLKLCGIKGKHDYGDMTVILGTAGVLTGVTVYTVKNFTKVERPDGSARNSFPSGHTATAFMGAELLRREYGDVSPWIGVAGYAVAAGTGFFRMYNNRHWLTDVIAGAGIGILGVQAAYWLYPVISKAFFHKRYIKNMYISPYVSENGKGLNCAITLDVF